MVVGRGDMGVTSLIWWWGVGDMGVTSLMWRWGRVTRV